MSRFTKLPEAIGVRSLDEARPVLDMLKGAPFLAVDTETTGLSRPGDRAVILALSSGEDRYAVWPELFHHFKPLIENPETKLIMHNANFDQWMLKNVGIDCDRYTEPGYSRVYDTMVMHALLNDQAPHDLKSLSHHYLGITMVPFTRVFGAQMRKVTNGERRPLGEILLDPDNYGVVCNYAALDAYATFQLFLRLRNEMKDMTIHKRSSPYESMWDYYVDSEVAYTKILWHMELAGVKVDPQKLEDMKPGLEEEIKKVERWFVQMTENQTINLKSNPQLKKLFFEDLGKVPISHTEKGQPQLNSVALKKWATSDPPCEYSKNLLDHRDKVKKLNTYVIGIQKLLHDKTGRLHASFNQTGARTGRLSSSQPNLQNQPKYIRDCYIAKPGHLFMASDFSQLEMRILAHMSGDENLVEAILSGKDVHAATAAVMFGSVYDDIIAATALDDANTERTLLKEAPIPLSDYHVELLKQRKAAKTINFGLMYGQGPTALALTMGWTKDHAIEVINQYFAQFSDVKYYFDDAINAAKATGYCQTLMGRRRQVGNINSILRSDEASARRQVKNSPIQGTASEITKLAMLNIWNDPYIRSTGSKMLIQVHDEVVIEGPEELVNDDEFNRRVRACMEHPLPYDLIVPLAITTGWGRDWAAVK